MCVKLKILYPLQIYQNKTKLENILMRKNKAMI